MLIVVKRVKSTKNSTVGMLSVDDKQNLCVTLEDGFRDPKVPHFTRVPAGEYEVTLRTVGGFHARYTKKFGSDFHKGMLWIRNVPGFEYVLFHIGNSVDDTSGCILVGTTIAEPNSMFSEFRIWESRKAYVKFYPLVRDALLSGEKVRVRIEDD